MGGINIKRKNKVLMALTVFLILFVLIGSVNAAKDNTTISQDNNKEINQEKTGIDESSLNKEILKTNNENTTLKTPVSGDTFADIQDAIDSATEGDTIELNGLYKGTGTQITITQNNLTIIGTNNATLDAQGLSEIMTISGNDVTLKNINFINGKVTTSGGAIYWTGDNGTVTNCIFINNTATSSDSAGGAIYWNATNGQVTNCTFTKNTAISAYYGGGAIYWDAANGQVTNCIFTKNTAYDSGGAIYWNGENGTVTGCNFTGHTVNGYSGGAIRWNGENGTVTGCNFTGNTGHEGGGAIYWQGANGTVTDCNFTGNTAEFGGAISWSGLEGNVIGCTFTGNTANMDGGAIYWWGANGTVTGCNFTGNTVDDSGGAIYWHSANGTVTGCSFTGNTADDYYGSGGAIEWNGDYGTVTGCNFTDNTVSRYGGAIVWAYDANDGTVTGCSFTGNTADDNGDGGAIFWSGANGTVTGCNFTGNTGGNNGGAIVWGGDNGVLTGCNFTGNTAFNDGGAIYWNGENGTVTGCSFTGNTGGNNGGAIYWSEKNGKVTGCTFTNNTATSSSADYGGGAIYWNGANGVISNSIFNDNKAHYRNIYISKYGLDSFILSNSTLETIVTISQIPDCVVGSNININITFDDGTNLKNYNVNLLNNNKVIHTFTYNNTYNYIYNWNNLAAGDYSITVGDINTKNNKYVADYSPMTFKVTGNKNGSSVSINPITNVTYNTDVVVDFVVENRTNVTITITNVVTGEKRTFYDVIGSEFRINTLSVGTYNITIMNSENEYYTSSNASALFNVMKASSKVEINSIINGTYHTTNATVNFNIINSTTTHITIIDKNGAIVYDKDYNSNKFSIGNLAIGTYNITIINNENENYTSSNTSAIFNVAKATSEVEITGIINGTYKTTNATVNFNIINSTSVHITVRDARTGSVVYDNTNFIGTVFTIGNLTIGVYNITIINNGNENYTTSSASALFNIAKTKLNPDDIIINVTPGESNATVNITGLPEDFTGDVSVIINGTSYPVSVVNGTGIEVIPLVPGEYDLTGVNITNNPIYDDTFIPKDETINIDKKIVNPEDIIVNITPGNGNATINITAPKDFNGNIDVLIDNDSYPIEVINGTGSKIIALTPGKHILTSINIINNQIYNDIFIPKDIQFVVLKKDTILIASDINFIINYGGRYTVSTNLGMGKTIILIINNQNINAITDANGVATFELTKTNIEPVGVKTVTIIFNGDTNFNNALLNSIITVNKDSTNIIGKSAKKSYKKTDNKKIQITLKDSTGKSLGKVKINLKAKKLKGKLGKKLKKGYDIPIKFNSKGIGYITLKNSKVNGFKKGTYKFSVTYKGSDVYTPSTNQIKMKIK